MNPRVGQDSCPWLFHKLIVPRLSGRHISFLNCVLDSDFLLVHDMLRRSEVFKIIIERELKILLIESIPINKQLVFQFLIRYVSLELWLVAHVVMDGDLGLSILISVIPILEREALKVHLNLH